MFVIVGVFVCLGLEWCEVIWFVGVVVEDCFCFFLGMIVVV